MSRADFERQRGMIVIRFHGYLPSGERGGVHGSRRQEDNAAGAAVHGCVQAGAVRLVLEDEPRYSCFELSRAQPPRNDLCLGGTWTGRRARIEAAVQIALPELP